MNIVLLEGLGVPQALLEKHIQKLQAMGHTFTAFEKDTDPAAQQARCQDADAVMLANMPLAQAAVEQSPRLKFIDVAFTGVDHIPVEAAKKRGIVVSNASGYATQAVAELCISFMIQLLRNTAQTGQRCRQGGTKDGLVGRLLAGKTVGIVGAGAIGRRVAALSRAFGCRVLAYSRSPVQDPAIDEQVSLDQLLAQSDIVSLHCPLTPQTKGLIGQAELARMKKTAYLVNTARGGVVDSAALAQALSAGSLAGAACDVFEAEPPIPQDHPLLHSPNTIVTPHIAFASAESMEQRAEIVFGNLYAWLEGSPTNCI